MSVLPKVSIISPTFNNEKYITSFLNSVINQTYSNYELIIINDGSTDNTKAILDSFIPIFKESGIYYLIINISHSGASKAINQGLQYLNGEYITWPDSDDILAENHLVLLIDAIISMKNEDYKVARGKRAFFKKKIENLTLKDNYSNWDNEIIFDDIIRKKTIISGGCYLIESDLFFETLTNGKIYENEEGQNFQMLLPAASQSKVISINNVIYYVREHSLSHSRHQRSTQEMIIRQFNIMDIFENTLNNCDCDYENSLKIAVKDKLIQIIILSKNLEEHDTELYLQQFKNTYSGVEFLKLLFYMFRHKIKFFLRRH